MVDQKKVKGFFAGVEGEQGSSQPDLLPTRTKDGAPAGNRWLLHMVEGEVEVRHTKDDEFPYLSYRAEVDEPDEYAGRTVFGMFFFPRPVDGGDEEEVQEKYNNQVARVVGQVDAILGPGTCGGLEEEELEATLEELAPLLENAAFVGKIGKERGKRKDPDDQAKDAERYPDRNRISYFEPADTWVSADA
mgnify:FL=1